MFLIIAGAITAAGLPFALAFPPTFVLKLVAITLLVVVAAAIAAVIRRRKSE
jgi:hypothetical protein